MIKFEYKQLLYKGELEDRYMIFPDGTKFCHRESYGKIQENWVAMIPVNNYSDDYVPHYESSGLCPSVLNMIDYDIVFFTNIVTTNKYKAYLTMTKKDFDIEFNDYFKSVYIYTYSDALFKFDRERFLNTIDDGILPDLECVEEEKLLKATRLLSIDNIFQDNHFKVIDVHCRISYGEHTECHSIEITSTSNQILYTKPFTGNRHRVITHDSTVYDNLFDDTVALFRNQ